MPRNGRPALIWAALALLWVTAVLHIYVLIKYSYLGVISGSELLIGIGVALLVSLTIFGIYDRSSWARRLATLCFVLTALLQFSNLVLLLNWPEKNNAEWTFSIALVITRIVIGLCLAVAFGISGSVGKYFAPDVNRSLPPPPPSFHA